MPEREETRESSRAAPAPTTSTDVVETLPGGIELIDLGGNRYQVRHTHRIVGTLDEGSGGHQAFNGAGRTLGTFGSRRKAIDAMLEAL